MQTEWTAAETFAAIEAEVIKKVVPLAIEVRAFVKRIEAAHGLQTIVVTEAPKGPILKAAVDRGRRWVYHHDDELYTMEPSKEDTPEATALHTIIDALNEVKQQIALAVRTRGEIRGLVYTVAS